MMKICTQLYTKVKGIYIRNISYVTYVTVCDNAIREYLNLTLYIIAGVIKLNIQNTMTFVTRKMIIASKNSSKIDR